jgi:hypothetical protein
LALYLPMALQSGAAPLLNLGCLSKAASEPISGAKVPFAIALAGCPSCGGQRSGSRWQANAQQASRSRGCATPVRLSKLFAPGSQASRPSQPWCAAVARSPGIIEFWPTGQASGKMPENQIKGASIMRRPNINSQGKVSLFSTPSPSRQSLTVGSTRTKMLRIFAG